MGLLNLFQKKKQAVDDDFEYLQSLGNNQQSWPLLVQDTQLPTFLPTITFDNPTQKMRIQLAPIQSISLVALTGVLSACAPLQITPAPGQNMVFQQGKACVIPLKQNGQKQGIGVIGTGSYEGGRAVFTVFFHNQTKSHVNFGLENITATDAKGKPLRIYTPQEITQQIRMQAAMQAMAVGLSAGCQSFAASQPSYTSYSGSYNGYSNYNAYNAYGRPLGSLQGYQNGSIYGSSTTYNPAQVAIANQAIQANAMNQMSMIGNQMQGQLGIANQMLATTTVPPNTQYAGILIVKQSTVTNLKFVFAGQECSASFLEK
jgi:hypothetical protein